MLAPSSGSDQPLDDGAPFRVSIDHRESICDRAGLRALEGACRRLLRRGRAVDVVGASPVLASALTRLRHADTPEPAADVRPA